MRLYILKPAIKEIKQFSDIEVTKLEEHKRSRKVIGFTIHFKRKQFIDSESTQEQPAPQPESKPAPQPETQPTPQPEEQPQDQRQARLEKLRLNVPEEYRITNVRDIISDNLDKYDDETIISNIEYTMVHKPDTNFAGYLVKALKDDYAKTIREQQKLDREKAEQEKKEKQQQEFLMKKQRAISDWWGTTLDEQLSRMSPDDKKILEGQATDRLKASTPGFNTIPIPRGSLDAKMREILKQKLESQGVKPPENLA